MNDKIYFLLIVSYVQVVEGIFLYKLSQYNLQLAVVLPQNSNMYIRRKTNMKVCFTLSLSLSSKKK